MIMKHIIPMMLALQFTSGASELLLLGFNGKRAPSIDKTFDKMVREELVMMPYITLIDIEKTRQLNHYINFPENDLIAETDLESLRKYLNDSLYIVWGTLHEIVIEPTRKQFIKAQFSGWMQVDLHIYDFVKKRITYAGTLDASTSEDRGIIFFSPVKRAYHIGATEYTKIVETTLNEAVRVCNRVIAATISSDNAKAEHERILEQNSGAVSGDTLKKSMKSTTYNTNGNTPPDSVREKVSPVPIDTGISKEKTDTGSVSKQTKTP
jgi:hypothetical protein